MKIIINASDEAGRAARTYWLAFLPGSSSRRRVRRLVMRLFS
jgi:hypothetical protein